MGGLCSKNDRETFDDVKSGNHAGPKQNANNHVAAGEQPTHAEATVPASELIVLKAQLQQLQDRNSALQGELSEAKDTARSYAELQSKHQDLQTELGGLQREFEMARQQLAGSGQQAQLDARAEAERKLAEVQKQYTELKSMNNQLRRRVSDLATGHAEPPVAAPPAAEEPSTAAEECSRDILAKIRDSNPGSKISVAFWRSSDFKRWQGVRTVNGEVTGLALNSMQLTSLPSEVGQLSSLTALLLSNNSLSQLPPTLGQLTSLTSLMLDGNNLKQLPAELCDLTQLQTLWLHDNQLASLPHALGKLTNLRQLIVNDNALDQLPASIGELKGLTSLWLDNNKITELPETFSQLTELKRLRVDSVLSKLVPEHFRGIGTIAQSRSPRGGGSTLSAVEGFLAREAEEGSSAQNKLPGQEPAESRNSAEEQQRQTDADAGPDGGGAAEAHTTTVDQPDVVAGLDGGAAGSVSVESEIPGTKKPLLAGSLSGTGPLTGSGMAADRREPVDGQTTYEQATAS